MRTTELIEKLERELAELKRSAAAQKKKPKCWLTKPGGVFCDIPDCGCSGYRSGTDAGNGL